MADGDGVGVPGSEWSRQDRARPGVHHGRTLNPTPLASALPAPYPAFNVMGGSSGGSSGSIRPPHPVLWHSVPPIVGTSPSAPFPVSIPPVYFTHPPPMPPMEFPSLMKLDIPPMRTPSGVVGAMPLPLPLPLFHPHPRSNLPSGMKEVGVSSGDRTPATLNINIPVPASATGDQNSVDKSESEQRLSTSVNKQKAVSPIAPSISPPADFLSSDPSVSFTEPPPVPESFPRDPAPQGGRGEGWPYAPQGWPNPDDKWGWRVGKRASASSLWIDRYVTVPASLVRGKRLAYKTEFASRKSLVEYLRQNFPQMKDPYSIFKAFDWKVPAPKDFEAPEKPEKRGPSVKRDKPSDIEENEQKSKKQCQAGNPHCVLTKAKHSESESLGVLACHICCSEPSFCRECKCILCCKFFAPDADDFSIIRCLNSPTSAQGICGHAAHLECALDSRLAGVIKKSGLDMEYMCRRCDRKTDLKEIVGRLVSEFMSKTATESKVENSLQLLLRVVQDPEEEARNSGKLQTTLIGALKKVQDGADLVESCRELTEELLELRSGRSRAMGRKREWEDLLHPSETTSDKRVPQSKTVDLPDARIDSMTVNQGVCEADRFTITCGARVEPDLDMDKDLPSTSLQEPPKPEDHAVSSTISKIPSELLSFTPLLSSLLDQSVCKPPTLSLEEHIRQCEAMANRVKGAGQLTASPSTFSLSLPGTLEVVLNSDSKPQSVTAGFLTVGLNENQVVFPEAEASNNTDPPCAEERVTSIYSCSRDKNLCLFNSHDEAEDHVENTDIIEDDEVQEACIDHAFGSIKTVEGDEKAMEDGNKSTQDLGGDDTANTKIIEVSKSSGTKPPTTSTSGGKGPSLTDSEDAAEGDVVITQIIEVPPEEPVTLPSFDPARETAHAAGLQVEFEEQISDALEKLKRAHAAEYARAEESLNAQKKIVIEQYRQLESGCAQFTKKKNALLFLHQFKKTHKDKPRAEFDRAMNHLMTQYGKAQEGQRVFESMLAISNGFGKVNPEVCIVFPGSYKAKSEGELRSQRLRSFPEAAIRGSTASKQIH
ncbi:hypothetical protein KC19_2G260300 [Ceratodon purpureus]|uniref:Uncharacterized protein n=1 Tax=Ceratodon purpureus TaxID=3225 RepID=A0A8T0IY42_CERPU|nr:hypothetical protein KC19_2G260300 [Ceratodon purpureus]